MNRQHIGCPCGKSSDAYTEYPDGGFCFSCGKKFVDKSKNLERPKDEEYTLQSVPYRNHSLQSLEKYRIKTKVARSDGRPLGVIYEYHNQGKKHRNFGETHDKFVWDKYPGPGLFGIEFFEAGASPYVTITEGEEDAVAAYEMLGSKYPVYSVQSASQAGRDCAANKAELDKYERIYLCLDMDKPGRQATEKIAALFPFEKVYVVTLSKGKDANEYLHNGLQKDFVAAWYAAKRFNPENVISSYEDIRELFNTPAKKAICTFPFHGLQEATRGIRKGETYLFKALEGIGKTEVMGAIEYHILKTTDLPIGIIHLEEDLKRTTLRFVNYETGIPVHLEGASPYTPDEEFEIYKKVTKLDNRVAYYKQGKNDSDVDIFLNAIRFLVASAGCEAVCFDHISRVATAFGLDTNGLDQFATALSTMAMELDFALIMVSHVNDDGLTRGSRNISKEAWTVVSLKRDMLSADPFVRNRTDFVVEKNRHASITGPAGSVYFNAETFTLSDEPPAVLPEVE